MSVPVISFFNNKGGVGKTSLVYHIAWMMSDLSYRVLAVDLDPQCNLTAAFIDNERLDSLWSKGSERQTIHGAIGPLSKGMGDVGCPYLEKITNQLALIPGDMALSGFEDDLSQEWPKCLNGNERSFRVISAFWRVMQEGAKLHQADFILMDLGPNLGAINRSALIASDVVVIPLGPDLFSLQGLENLGPTLRGWRKDWQDRLGRKTAGVDFELPQGKMHSIGYIVMQHSMRGSKPVKSYDKWIGRIPETYHRCVLEDELGQRIRPEDDSECLTLLKHYRSLMPMAQEAHRPIFHLKSADGALGAQIYAVKDAHADFEDVTKKIIQATEHQLGLISDRAG